jgi:hypothetical protein
VFLNWPILLALLVVFGVLRWRRAGMLTWSLAWWIGLLLALKYGFVTPIPASVQTIYMWITTAAILAYVSSDRDRWASFYRPLLALILDPRYRVALVALARARCGQRLPAVERAPRSTLVRTYGPSRAARHDHRA